MALLTCAGLWGACKPPERHASPPLRVEYDGCAQVFLPGLVCAPEETKQLRLHLWVALPPEVPIEVRAGGRWLRSPGIAVQGGQQLILDVPARVAAVEVRAAAPAGGAAWSMVLGPFRQEPGAALSQQARAALRRGDNEAALALLTQAMAAHHAAGSLLAEANDATVLAWLQIQRRQFGMARQLLSGLMLPAGSPGKAMYYRSYYRGLLEEQVGNVRSALVDLQGAVDQAERVGLELERWDAEQVLGRQLQSLGRSRDAAALFERLRRAPPARLSLCDQANLLNNQAWSLLLAREAGDSLEGAPIPLLEEAQRASEQAKCSSPEEERLNYLLNLTLAYLQEGWPTQARASLTAARALDRFTTPVLRLWSLELEARLDLADGRPEKALQLYDRLDELAASALSPEGRWRAAYGRARCYGAMSHPAEALAAFGKAEALLDEQSLQVPIHEGRETFTAQREGATGLHLELLLAGGRNAEALDVARRARSRVLRQLARGDRLAHLPAAERERWEGSLAEYRQRHAALDADAAADWELPADQSARKRVARAGQYKEVERILDQAFTVLGALGGGLGERAADLVPPRPGEVILTYHPLPRGWVGFAAVGGVVMVHRFELPEGLLAQPGELAARLLAPFRTQIEQSGRVRILPYGRLRDVDFHALPFGGDILLAARPVVYGLDLAVPANDLPPGRRALVVADPLSNLPAAVLEAGAVTAALQRQQPAWRTEPLRGEEATAVAVRNALSGGVALLHYAGHGVFSGAGGWESVLPLADGTRLTAGDLLALDRVPPWVVLSGCETGRSSADAPVEGLGLAQAFLLAGSRSVIAATRRVGDRAAEGLFTELYQHWGPAPDLAVLLQHAQLAWRQREPAAGWESFRLFEP